METALKEMDQVRLKRNIGGPLVAGTVGVILKAERDTNFYPLLVAFPTLRKGLGTDQWSEWLTDKIDVEQFHRGDVVPMKHDELEFIQSLTPGD